MELNTPPRSEKIMASTGYPLLRMFGRNFSRRKANMGAKAPMSSEAKGSMITADDELRNIPD